MSSEYPEKPPSASGECPEHNLLSLEYSGKSPSLGAITWTPTTVFRLCREIPFCPLGNSLTPHCALRMSKETPFCQWGIPRKPTSILRISQETAFSWGICRTIPSAFRIYQEIPFCQWGALDTIFSDQIPKEITSVSGESPGYHLLSLEYQANLLLSVGSPVDTKCRPENIPGNPHPSVGNPLDTVF